MPAFSLVSGSYTGAQSVTISDATGGAAIYYTTNGAAPTTNSTLYSGAISVSTSETLEAIGAEAGYSSSAVASAAFAIQAVAPSFSPAAGTYTTIQTVTISTTTPSATIYYTTDGNTPTTNSTVYSSAIAVSTTETLSAITAATGDTASAVGSALYTINLPTASTPGFSPAAGTYTGPNRYRSAMQRLTRPSTTPPTGRRRQPPQRNTPLRSVFQRMRRWKRSQRPITTSPARPAPRLIPSSQPRRSSVLRPEVTTAARL